uniref:G-protein coupled receptors family 2 profile 2 domain-containing protein n=1 Tax=Strigamia maritima TaxID=126957 RepID=T1ITI7_STRMM
MSNPPLKTTSAAQLLIKTSVPVATPTTTLPSPNILQTTSTLWTTSEQTLPEKAVFEEDRILFRHRCPAEWHESIWWNETHGGVIATRHCPAGYVGNAYRLCFYGSAWGEIDMSECRVSQVIHLKHLVYHHLHKNMTDVFPNLAQDLLTTLDTYRLHSLDDVLEALDMVAILLGSRMHLDLATPDHARIIQTLLNICDRLFTHQKQGWSPPVNQQELITLKVVQVLHSMGVLSCVVADGLKRAGLKSFKVDYLPHTGLSAQLTDATNDYVFNRVHCNQTGEDSGDRIIVPAVSTSRYTIRASTPHHVIVILWYSGFPQRLEDPDTVVNSAIISSSVHPGKNYFMADPVTIVLKTLQQWDSSKFKVQCGHLKQSTNRSSLWSFDGCSVEKIEVHQVTCKCQHANNLAVLLQRIKHEKTKLLPEPLNGLVVFGCFVALLMLILTMVAHAHLLRYEQDIKATTAVVIGVSNIGLLEYRLTNKSHIGFLDAAESTLILFNLVISMAATQVVFMSGIEATNNKAKLEFCSGVSIVLHYLHLVTTFWMLAHGIHLYVSVRNIPNDHVVNHTRDYCLLAWIVPVILVVITFIVNPRGYETRTYCWLSIERGMLLSFIVPVSALIMINTTLMVMVLKNFFEMRAITKKQDVDRIRIGLRMGVVLLPLFGVNWFLGVLALEDTSTMFFEGAFAFTNSLQGFLVFFFNCIINTEIRHSLHKKFCTRRKATKALDLRLRRSKKRSWKLDAQPLLVAPTESSAIVIPAPQPPITNEIHAMAT